MNIIEELSKFKPVVESNDELMSLDDYTWKNTINRTVDHDWENQLKRFSDKVNILAETLNTLIQENKLKENFSVLELFCGNGIVLHMLKQRFPKCIPIGIDLLHFEMWDDINKEYPDVNFIQANFFDIHKSNLKLNLDVMVTYNTWRGWDNGVGPGTANLLSANEFMNWAETNFKYIVADNTILIDKKI